MKTVLLKDICKPKQWKTIPVSKLKDKGYPVYGANGIIGYWHEYNHEKPTILVTCRGATCGEINVSSPKSYITGNAMCLDGLDKNYSLDFIEAFLRAYDFGKVISGTAQPQITKSGIGQIPIPILSLSEQKILTERFRRILKLISLGKNALKIYDDLVKSRFVEMFKVNHYEKLQLSEIGKLQSGGTPARSCTSYFEGDIDWYSAGELNQFKLAGSKEKITQKAIKESSAKLFPAGSLLIGMYDTAALKMGSIEKPSSSNQACACFTPHTDMELIWLFYEIDYQKPKLLARRNGCRQKNLNLGFIKSIEVEFPPLSLQQEFAVFVHQVDKLKFDLGICLFILREETFRLSG